MKVALKPHFSRLMRAGVALSIAIVLSLALAASVPALESVGGSKDPSRGGVKPRPSFQSTIEVKVDLKEAAKASTLPSKISSAVDQFLNSHSAFTLSDLEIVQVANERGSSVKLSQVAKVEVRFERTNDKSAKNGAMP